MINVVEKWRLAKRINHYSLINSQFSFSVSLRTPEQPTIHSFPENVSLHRFHHIRSRFKCVSRWFDVEFCIQRIELEHVVMVRTIRGSAGTTIDLPGRADLITTIRQLWSFGNTFRQTLCRCWNIPHDPMRLIVGGFISRNIHVVHVQEETLRTSGCVRPCDRR